MSRFSLRRGVALSHSLTAPPCAGRSARQCLALGVALAILGLLPFACAADAVDAPGASVASLHAWLLANNPDLRAMTIEAEAATARIQPAGALPDPMAVIELRDIDADRPRVLPSQTGSTFYQVRQRIPLWGKRGLARDAATADAESAGYRRDARARELLATAETAYVSYWHAGASTEALAGVIDVLGDLQRLTTTRYESGLAPQQDALKSQVERTALARERIERVALRREAAAMLNAVLARAPEAPLAEPATEPEIDIPTDLLATFAVDRHPAVGAEAAALAAAEERRKLAYRNRYPDLTVGIAPIQVGSRLEAWELMFEVEIPFQQRTRRNQEREAVLMRDAAQARRDAAVAELNGRFGEAHARWIGAQEQRALIEHTLLPQAEANYRSALASYQVGAVDFTTLLEALRERRQTELTRLDVIRDALLAAAELRSLTGVTP